MNKNLKLYCGVLNPDKGNVIKVYDDTCYYFDNYYRLYFVNDNMNISELSKHIVYEVPVDEDLFECNKEKSCYGKLVTNTELLDSLDLSKYDAIIASRKVCEGIFENPENNKKYDINKFYYVDDILYIKDQEKKAIIPVGYCSIRSYIKNLPL